MNAKKIVTAGLALVMVAGISVAGTLAYLTAQTTEKINTFTVGDISIELTEPDWTAGTGSEKILPGDEVPKDPTVTVKANSEACYVYVAIDNGLKLDDGTLAGTLDIDSANWNVVKTSGDTTVYRYKEVVDTGAADTVLPDVFTTVTVSPSVTSENIGQLDGDKITAQAYAHQSQNVEQGVADAAALAFFEIA